MSRKQNAGRPRRLVGKALWPHGAITDEVIESFIARSTKQFANAPADRQDYKAASASLKRLRKITTAWLKEIEALRNITKPDSGNDEQNIAHIWRLLETTMPDLGGHPIDRLIGWQERLERELLWLGNMTGPKRGPSRHDPCRNFVWRLADLFEAQTGQSATASWAEGPTGEFARFLHSCWPTLPKEWRGASEEALNKLAVRCLKERKIARS